MNFKDRIKKTQQENVSKQNSSNKTTNIKNLYQEITNHLSQQYQPGDLKKNQHIPIIKKNTKIQQTNYQQNILQTQPQNYIEKKTIKTKNHQPSSLLNENSDNGQFFQSKLNQTRSELQDQIFDVEKRLTRELENNKFFSEDFIAWNVRKNFNIMKQENRTEQQKIMNALVTQLNSSLSINSKKNKILQTNLQQNQQKINNLSKQLNNYINQMQQKMQRIMNSNSNIDLANSMKKSISKNIPDYTVQLKNSIKQIPSIPMLDQIKNQINQTSQALKLVKFEISQLRQQNKINTYQNKSDKNQIFEKTQLDFIRNEINSLKIHLQQFETEKDSKFNEFRCILEIQQQNLKGMNQTLRKVINNQLLPRLKKLQDLQQPHILQTQTQTLKKQILKQLESIPIIKVKQNHKNMQKITKMKNLQKNQQNTYMINQNNQILDIFGNYLIDQNNQKITLNQQQIYYLQNIQAIQIQSLINY